MGYRLALLATAALFAALSGGCGKEIGDSCVLSTDCSPNGDRICVCSNCTTSTEGTSDEGYCTVQGCDYSTCPQESACIRFFTGEFTAPNDASNHPKTCLPEGSPVTFDPAENIECTLDELCAIDGQCVPRSSEVRYCMRTCESDGDCRDGFECRDFDLMKAHGGEAVLAPGVPVDESHSPKFCAAKPK